RQAPGLVKESAERISAAGPVVSDAVLGPAAVINRVIGLHRRDHVQFCEAAEVFGSHVLRVLDAPTAITAAMLFFNFDINVEDRRNSSVSDGVRAELQTSGIGSHHSLAPQGGRM